MAISSEWIKDSVIHNLAEGIIIITFDGTIEYANPAAFTILDIPEEQMTGSKFAEVFFSNPDNDEFAQTVLDAVYAETHPMDKVVPYRTGGDQKHLHVLTSFFRDPEGRPAGVTMVFSDLSELMELRDSLDTLEHINSLNRQLNARNALLSKTFGQFLSDEIVKQLLETPGGPALGGKKKMLTVMMSDLRGFTAMSEKMDAGDLISMLNHYLGVMTNVIQKRGGTIIEFIGDGILAIFGAPIPSEEHSTQAVAAALEMEKAMDDINLWNAERNYPRLEMGIGIDCGEVIVGNIGSEKRMKYGVVGSHVNLCGRIESYCVGGQILISPDVRARIQAPLKISKEIMVSPKGAEEEMMLSQVTGLGEPYDISVTAQKDAPIQIEHPLPVCFKRISEKHTMEKNYFGGFTAVGRYSAVLETETALELFDNLRINAGGQLFCKVMEKKDDGYFLHYTSIPLEYDKWIREELEKEGNNVNKILL